VEEIVAALRLVRNQRLTEIFEVNTCPKMIFLSHTSHVAGRLHHPWHLKLKLLMNVNVAPVVEA